MMPWFGGQRELPRPTVAASDMAGAGNWGGGGVIDNSWGAGGLATDSTWPAPVNWAQEPVNNGWAPSPAGRAGRLPDPPPPTRAYTHPMTHYASTSQVPADEYATHNRLQKRLGSGFEQEYQKSKSKSKGKGKQRALDEITFAEPLDDHPSRRHLDQYYNYAPTEYEAQRYYGTEPEAYQNTYYSSPFFGAMPMAGHSQSRARNIAEQATESTSLFVNARQHIVATAQTAFYSSRRPSTERFHWMMPQDHDPRVKRLMMMLAMKTVKEELVEIGLNHFLTLKGPGAILINADLGPWKDTSQIPYDWVTYDEARPTKDRIFQQSIMYYNPSEEVVVLVFLLSHSANSVACWRRKIKLSPAPNKKTLQKIDKIKAEMKTKQYVIEVDGPDYRPPQQYYTQQWYSPYHQQEDYDMSRFYYGQ